MPARWYHKLVWKLFPTSLGQLIQNKFMWIMAATFDYNYDGTPTMTEFYFGPVKNCPFK